jgi:hypothetical protein
MKKVTVLPTAANNLPVTIIASAVFIIGLFAIAAGVVIFCAVNQILGTYSPYIFFGLLFGGVLLWRFLLGLAVKPFAKPERPDKEK